MPRTEKLFYIQNRGYSGNCLIWWRQSRCGYTCNLDEAGQFTEAEAKKICSSRDKEDIAWSVELVDANSQRHLTDSGLYNITRVLKNRSHRKKAPEDFSTLSFPQPNTV